MIEEALHFLLPTWWEVEITVAAAVFVIITYWFFTYGNGDVDENQAIREGLIGDGIDDKMAQLKGDPQTNSAYVIKLELLAAKNLIGANLNGMSDPYAIITCGEEKRFSSMVPGSRNPMWGEEFNFAVDDLPVKVQVVHRKMALLRGRDFEGNQDVTLINIFVNYIRTS